MGVCSLVTRLSPLRLCVDSLTFMWVQRSKLISHAWEEGEPGDEAREFILQP